MNAPSGTETQVTAALRRAAVAATLAPSVHNTQPWRLRLRRDGLDVLADRARRLPVLDPTGRHLLLSCGCAVMNARVSLAGSGFATAVTVGRHLAHHDLLASITIEPGPPDTALAALAPFVRTRHTNRWAFGPGPLPPTLLDTLVAAATVEGAALVPVRGAKERERIAMLSRQADEVENLNPAYRAELRAWTTDDPERRDGVPVRAAPSATAGDNGDPPTRVFHGDAPVHHHTGAGPPATVTLAVLATSHDCPGAWLRAGQALERLWLEVTRAGHAATPLSQIIEVPATRARMRSILRMSGHPHLLLRIGRSRPAAPTPRRHLTDVLEP